MFKVIIHRKALNEINAVSEREKRRLLDAVRAMSLDPFSGDVNRKVFERRLP